MADAIRHGADDITVDVKVVSFTDRPGISRVYLNGTCVFDANAEQTTSELSLKVKLPFHIHFVAPELSMSLAWREEQL